MNVLPDNVIAFPQLDESDDAVLDDVCARVEPGLYVVTYLRHKKIRIFGKGNRLTPKLRIDFQLLAHPDIVLSRWYRIHDWHKGNRISAGGRSDIVREMQAALGKRIRPSQIYVSTLKGVCVNARVRDVIVDHRQRQLAPINVYSVIDELTAVPA